MILKKYQSVKWVIWTALSIYFDAVLIRLQRNAAPSRTFSTDGAGETVKKNSSACLPPRPYSDWQLISVLPQSCRTASYV